MRIGDKFTALRRDDYDTPVEAWDLLLDKMKTIPKKIWAPFYNNGSLKDKLKARNIPIIHMKKDFFTYEPKEWDVVIDNPSYSNKKAILTIFFPGDLFNWFCLKSVEIFLASISFKLNTFFIKFGLLKASVLINVTCLNFFL